MTAKCIELVAVYDDGRVERWDERLSEFIEQTIPFGSEFNGITTQPLRQVTEVRGRYYRASRDGDPARIEDDRGVVVVTLPSLLPQIVMFDDAPRCDIGPLCDFRITVEAIPVEVK